VDKTEQFEIDYETYNQFPDFLFNKPDIKVEFYYLPYTRTIIKPIQLNGTGSPES
jgi:hypothetical protein